MSNLETILKEYNPEIPLEEATLIPKTWYTSSEIYELERKAIFAKGWHYAGKSSELAKPGDYITLEIANEPILIGRSKTNELNAMTNICRHKAAKVMTAPKGNAPAFNCRYHGWTYDLQGNLKAAPEMGCERNFDKAHICLPKFQVKEAGPFVFVNLSRESSDCVEFLSPLMEKVSPVMPSLKWHSQKTYSVNCNWKVYIDNYLDGGYHVNTVHPALARSLTYKGYETLLFNETVLQQSPLEVAKDAELNVRGGDKAYYFWLMPNFMVNLYANVMDTNWVLPDGPDRCQVVFDFYFGDVSSSFIEESLRVADIVQEEDRLVSENVQTGLNSQFYQPGRFCAKRENGNHHFHKLLSEKLWMGFAP